MDYKKIITSRHIRFIILRLLSFIPDAWMLRLQYWIKLKRWPNIKKPQRFTEKLQWYKLYYRDPVMGVCVDKYEVRKYVESKGLVHILNEQYGVYDRAEDIDFDALPSKFVIKTTDGGGGNNVLIIKEKDALGIAQCIKLCNSWLNVKDVNPGREWAYTQMKKSRLIVERYIENVDNPQKSISDYKFYCFYGKPSMIAVDVDRYSCHRRNLYDTEWNLLRVTTNDEIPETDNVLPKPSNLSEMIAVASSLSEDFPFARIDLYDVGNEIIFGEITFYPASGYQHFTPDSFDFELGKSWKCE